MQIIRQYERVTVVSYRRNFTKKSCPGAGYGFDCDEEGNVDIDNLPEEAMDNYLACVNGEFGVYDEGVVKYEHTYPNYAVGLCKCGEEVTLSGFTNTCDACGRDYNMSGQELAPRSQWGWDTGESLSDILRIP